MEKQSHDLLPWQLVETSLASTMSAMAQHSDREHLEEMWEILLVSLGTIFLLYFSMNSRDFSVKSKLITSLFQTGKLSFLISLFQK